MRIDELVQPKYPLTLSIVDVESTCWDNAEEKAKNTSEIIEIGIASVTKGSIRKEPAIAVKPQYSSVSPFCTKLTGITQKEVDGGLEPRVAFLKMSAILDKGVWASFGFYDKKQIVAMRDLYHLGFDLPAQHINVKELFNKLVLGIDDPYKDVGGVWGALERLGLKFEGKPHRGDDDAFNIARLYVAIVDKFGRE